MRFIGTSKVGTDPFSKGLRGQQAIVLDDVALGVHPFGFDGIEPGALRRQQERQNAHTLADLFALLIVLAKPGTNGLTLLKDRASHSGAQRLLLLVLCLPGSL